MQGSANPKTCDFHRKTGGMSQEAACAFRTTGRAGLGLDKGATPHCR